jgi:hypothetical protein
MEKRTIQDSQLSASSEVVIFEVGSARLRKSPGWVASIKDRKESQWYQIDFKTDATVKVFDIYSEIIVLAAWLKDECADTYCVIVCQFSTDGHTHTYTHTHNCTHEQFPLFKNCHA